MGDGTPCVLLTDDCMEAGEETAAGEMERSLQLVLSRGMLDVSLKMTNDSLDTSCRVQPDRDGWYDIVMESHHTDISLMVNGEQCVAFDAGATLARTHCPMFVGASPKGMPDAFKGHLDYFRFQ